LGFATNIGPSLRTNAAAGRPPSVVHCHHFDYTSDCPQLPAVHFTAASCDHCFLPAVDAIACTKESTNLRAVVSTDAGNAVLR
jgi:hypothetical protein